MYISVCKKGCGGGRRGFLTFNKKFSSRFVIHSRRASYVKKGSYSSNHTLITV